VSLLQPDSDTSTTNTESESEYKWRTDTKHAITIHVLFFDFEMSNN
jgi:hypothetical protein